MKTQQYALTGKVIEDVMYPPDKPALRTKLIPVWHIEYSTHVGDPCLEVRQSYEAAEELAKWFNEVTHMIGVTITGPHQHRIPA